jgi:hypothetical protein
MILPLVFILKKIELSTLGQIKKYVFSHLTDPIFQPQTLTFLIGIYSTLIFASDPINFYLFNR